MGKYLISIRVTNSVVKLLFFRFRVTNSRFKNKKFHFELPTRWVHSFSHFRVTNVKLIYKKIPWILQLQNDIDSIILLRFFFLYLACFVVSTYVILIWVIWILMAYVQQQMASSTKNLFTRLQKTFSSCEPKEEWPHAGSI